MPRARFGCRGPASIEFVYGADHWGYKSKSWTEGSIEKCELRATMERILYAGRYVDILVRKNRAHLCGKALHGHGCIYIYMCVLFSFLFLFFLNKCERAKKYLNPTSRCGWDATLNRRTLFTKSLSFARAYDAKIIPRYFPPGEKYISNLPTTCARTYVYIYIYTRIYILI